MKKLKIFLLLSILLCFGFVLSSEVHAQDVGPKVFEEGMVLPATTRLKIFWTDTSFLSDNKEFYVKTQSGNYIVDYMYYDVYGGMWFYVSYSDGSNNWFTNNVWFPGSGWSYCINEEYYFTNENGDYNYIIYDTSGLDENKRTIRRVVNNLTGDIPVYWVDLNAPSGYTITFNSNGGTTISDIENATELPLYLPIPTKENHTFLGWYYNSAFTQIANPGDIIESNVTLYAKWELNAYKPFEVGDVLPAGYIKISWDFTGKPISDSADFVILGDNDLNIVISEWDEDKIEMEINFDERFNLVTPGYTIITLTSPETITDLYNGNIHSDDDYYDYVHGAIFWEALPPEYLGDYDDLYDGELLDIEEDYILPQSKVGIKLLYNNTGGTKSGTITYTFGTYGQIILTAQEDNSSTQVTSAEITYNFTNPNWNIYMLDDSLANQSFGSTRGILFAGVLLDFSWATEEERTITDITIEGDLDIDVIFTRILTEEEIAYQEGYSNGYRTAREIFGWKDGDDWYNGIDAWNLGEKYARELYGFYDSTTGEWLSVSEYVARYGTGNGGGNGNGSTGASDFYNNFDKYFIPAMIIVFGGAIVLTILKVFKGRE